MTMEYVTLPNSELKVSRLCLGCWQFNDAQQSADKTWNAQTFQDSKAVVDKALELGINFLDTAEGYLNSEKVVGRILEGRRRDVVLATKVGARLQSYTPTDIEQSLLTSLENLKTDYIDLYQVHWPNFMGEHLKENLEEIKRQQAKGRIRHYAVCNFGPENMKTMKEVDYQAATNQVPYSLLWRPIEHEILPACREHNMGILAYSPLQQGLLTGKFLCLEDVPEGRRRTRLFNAKSTSLSKHGCEGAETQMFKTIHELKAVCEEVGVSLPQAALAWLLSQPQVSCCIMGASSPQQVVANCDMVKLDQAVVDRLTAATDELKELIGSNADPWAGNSRMS